MTTVLAADLGATSVRVASVDLETLRVRVLHRHPHGPVRAADGSLRWEWDRIVAEVIRGLEAGLSEGAVASIGIDTWGVDYGLLDGQGRLVAYPFSYRDNRTASWRSVAERIGEERLYRTAGIQLMPINTLFQLAAHARSEVAEARQLLMLPELLVYALTGKETGERTSAGTTGLVDVSTGKWSDDLLEAIGIESALMPAIARAGTPAGSCRGVPVHLVGGHDTASAVAALPGPTGPRTAFISSGTWMLVGAERPEADTSEAARSANFSNEPSVLGGVRFLRNIMGLWMLEQCLTGWGSGLDDAISAAARVPRGGPIVDATDERFLAPRDMDEEIRAAAAIPPRAGREVVVRCILDSLAAAAASVITELARFLREPVRDVVVLGGGGKNALLNGLIEEACGVPLRVGPSEATALGNALVQGIALDWFRDLEDARRALASLPSGAAGGC